MSELSADPEGLTIDCRACKILISMKSTMDPCQQLNQLKSHHCHPQYLRLRSICLSIPGDILSLASSNQNRIGMLDHNVKRVYGNLVLL